MVQRRILKFNNKIYIIGIVIAILIVIFFAKDKFRKDSVINVRCNNNIVSLSKNNKKVLNNYLKKEKLTKNENQVKCKAYGEYLIEYNDTKIIFDNDLCAIELYNNKTQENYQTSLSNDLTNYVKNICN